MKGRALDDPLVDAASLADASSASSKKPPTLSSSSIAWSEKPMNSRSHKPRSHLGRKHFEAFDCGHPMVVVERYRAVKQFATSG
jgi:hypothetical protein